MRNIFKTIIEFLVLGVLYSVYLLVLLILGCIFFTMPWISRTKSEVVYCIQAPCPPIVVTRHVTLFEYVKGMFNSDEQKRLQMQVEVDAMRKPIPQDQ